MRLVIPVAHDFTIVSGFETSVQVNRTIRRETYVGSQGKIEIRREDCKLFTLDEYREFSVNLDRNDFAVLRGLDKETTVVSLLIVDLDKVEWEPCTPNKVPSRRYMFPNDQTRSTDCDYNPETDYQLVVESTRSVVKGLPEGVVPNMDTLDAIVREHVTSISLWRYIKLHKLCDLTKLTKLKFYDSIFTVGPRKIEKAVDEVLSEHGKGVFKSLECLDFDMIPDDGVAKFFETFTITRLKKLTLRGTTPRNLSLPHLEVEELVLNQANHRVSLREVGRITYTAESGSLTKDTAKLVTLELTNELCSTTTIEKGAEVIDLTHIRTRELTKVKLGLTTMVFDSDVEPDGDKEETKEYQLELSLRTVPRLRHKNSKSAVY